MKKMFDATAVHSLLEGQKNSLLYDGECPVCQAYTQFIAFKAQVGPVELLNAREHQQLVDRLRERGCDINQGMLLWLNGNAYFADECLQIIAELSRTDDSLHRIVAWIFRSPIRARYLYPILRQGRFLLLKLLRRKPIDCPHAKAKT